MPNPIDMIPVVRKQFLMALACLTLSSAVPAQNLFTINGAGVSKQEFLKAYNKNNNEGKPTEKSYRDYLELYIRYKLKVRAAYESQLDTLAAQRTELQNFRAQVSESYLKDDASLDKLVKEAFNRGQQDIHLAHIFIAIPRTASVADTLRAYEKAVAADNALKKGRKFSEVARTYSDDPSAKNNGGDLGYITVFTLPYELENLAYGTAPGATSRLYRSKAGYHIFKNLGVRRSLGKMKAAQILLSIPPGATGVVQMTVRQRADSIYTALGQGADFATLAKNFSGDNLSYQSGGELPEFGVGKYDSSFEAAAFALDRDGAYTRPIPSSFGYHIIRRIARKPFPREFDTETAALLKTQVQNDPRIEISRKALFNKICQLASFRKGNYSETDLWTLTDSAMLNKALSSYRDLNVGTVLFSFDRKTYTVKEWLDYARASRGGRPANQIISGGIGAGVVGGPGAGSGGRTDKELFELYLERVALEYYRSHLEEFNTDFAFQLNEFKEGNLLFEIMQRKIWDKASTDSAGLRNYYEAHKNKYWWESSADALLFTCNNQKIAEDLKKGLGSSPAYFWRRLTDTLGAAVQADSGRYEVTQIPAAGGSGAMTGSGGSQTGATGQSGTSSPVVVAGQFTPFVPNTADNTVSFAYILNVYPQRAPRNYHDARGFVINDYQTYLEEQWIAALKKKYPVKIEETVFIGLPK
jgi:peptidyl-prolyl cis-trans isomerase SurA